MTTGLVMIALLVILAVLAPAISPYDPAKNDLLHRLMPPDAQHILGTDNLGRDQFARILYGTRLSISISFLILTVSMVAFALGRIRQIRKKMDLLMNRDEEGVSV